MPDVISLLHRGFYLNTDLFDPIEVGNYRLSIQGSKYHNCSPRETLPAYMYDTMEIAVYENGKTENIIPPAILHELKDKFNGWYFSGLTIREMQWLYDNLYLYSKLEMYQMMSTFFDSIFNIEYEEECIRQCILTHKTEDRFLKIILIRRMMLMLYGLG